MKNYHNHNLLLAVETICLISLPFILIFLLIEGNIMFCLYSLLSVLFITKLGQSIAQHRYFSHRSFKTNKITEAIMALAATLSTTGSILHYTLIHRYHHVNSDTEKDLHSPKNGDFWRVWFGLLDSTKTANLDLKRIKDSNKMGLEKSINVVASFGAAVVIVGALFKIVHWDGANEMLMVGMFTEAAIFILFGVLYLKAKPEKEYNWENVYPELVGGEAAAPRPLREGGPGGEVRAAERRLPLSGGGAAPCLPGA
jgi:fatty-acid desaturase